jgi:hypothetical protein
MPDIMKMGKNPNYLGSWDLDELPNREATLTIAKIVDEDVVTNGSKERCTVCYWTDRAFKPMIWNVTNKKMVAKLYHTKDTEKLIGKAVVVGVEQVKAFGDVHDALRIRKRIPKVEEAVKCADCGNDIQGAMGKGAAYIANYTKKKFGVCLCFDCAQKRSEATGKPEVVENGVKEDGSN